MPPVEGHLTSAGDVRIGFVCGKSKEVSARDVYVCFDNDIKVRAPFDVKNLRDRVERRLPPTDGPAILSTEVPSATPFPRPASDFELSGNDHWKRKEAHKWEARYLVQPRPT